MIDQPYLLTSLYLVTVLRAEFCFPLTLNVPEIEGDIEGPGSSHYVFCYTLQLKNRTNCEKMLA